MKNPFIFLLLLCSLLPQPVWSAAQQSHAAIRDAALAFAHTQTMNSPGDVTITVEEIDPRIALTTCIALDAFLPVGAQLRGKTNIGVRCNTKPGWTIFVQANIRVSLDLLVANKPLVQGTVLSAGDFSLQHGELGQPGILTDPAQAVGKTLKFAIGAGQVLRQDMLRTPFAILQGQNIKLQARGNGFNIGTQGLAMNDAAEGQSVRVKVASGQIVSAVAATDGSAEIR